MALRKPRDGNLSLLIQAIASAYHRDANGIPRYQPISFRTKGVISSATIHLWRHNGVENVTPRKLKALADAYGFDFPTVMGFIFGEPSRVEGDALLASLRRLPAVRVRPIGGGSHGAPTPSIVEVLEEIVSYQTWRRWLAWALPFPWVPA